eukprot:Em0016g124a
MLALRTTIGLMATMKEIKQRAQEADPLGTPLPSKGTLKTGRLQPLCRVVAPPQNVSQCLGIIPVMVPRPTGERPRSSTVDPVDHIWRRGENPDKRRSRSAIPVLLARFESPAVSPPRQLALVPQGRVPSHDSLDGDQTLPPAPSAAFSVEVKVTKRSGEHSGCTLPPIHSSMETQRPTTAAVHNTPTADQTSKVCIVSIGEETVEKPKSRGGHHSKRVTSGKLSLGWSPPKPVGPINGTSVLTATSPEGKRTQLSVQKNTTLSSFQECPDMGTVQERPDVSTVQEASHFQPVHIIMDQTLLEGQTDSPI